ncbi:uncharacterized protein EI90DRAFT_3069291 [Cantharellus anzutake]|uniref:uncharacterized protein n=1 Tax=Cantharellus anzutake TaxID=1750568 RepID=UPI001906D980|nr:uncharacterized protein EI90DRAFT_3069291 [Cantharellus anzutake]KAF8326860.1 hypothetical protein EI90DRAFT_3069291 [Cantharellus anzutake]
MQDFNLRIENHLDDIGPYAITMASQHLTVGGLMQFDVLLAGPPTPLLIRSLSAFIIAKYHLSSIQNPKKTPQTVEHKRRIFLVDYSNPPDRHAIHDAEGNKRILHSHDGLNQTHSNAPSTSSPVTPQGPSSVPSVPPRTPVPRRRFSERDTSVPSHCVRHDQRRSTIPPVAVTKLSPLHALPSATSYHISHLARLPSDEFIRPSTLKGTNTPIEISHDIVLELKFEHPESENDVKVLKVSKSLTISSCCCMIESLLVPTYSETDSIPSTPLPASPVDASPTMSLRSFAPRWQDNCVCERPTDWLIATQKLLGGGKTEEWEVRGMGGCPNAREKAEYQQVTEHNDV